MDLNMFFTRLLLPSIALFICLPILVCQTPVLPPGEVEALSKIGKTLGKKWNFSADANPCSEEPGLGWKTGPDDAVTCNCSFSNNTVCHIVSIVLKSQSLQGTLPPELTSLPFLQEIDLTRNYLNGTIPPQWGSTQLVNISLLGNRLTGSIPPEIGNISTLANLTLMFNQLSGAIPLELGNLSRIEKIHLNSNNFFGKLPETLAKLTTLQDFRIGDNNFTGEIPKFIQNWTNISRLMIEASGLDGPIPSGIALLTKLNDLRISDLKGAEQEFPPLNNIKKIKYLILRSCNLIGKIPDYLGNVEILNTLDLSFNKLNGEIPKNFDGLRKTTYIYLTGNLLAGPMPGWMQNDGINIDLSYNNITFEYSGNLACETRSVNLFGRSPSTTNTLGIVPCLRNFTCRKKWSSFQINCGGNEVKVDGNTIYEADTDSAGPSSFSQNSGTNWALSSTGDFLDNDQTDSYIYSTDASLPYVNNFDLYKDARLSPLSLTYYGFCLFNGNYTVKLHFAEIQFTDDKTYSSLGRRVFDVYIQGMLMLKDFNIAEKAGGVRKEITETFYVLVNDTTLEIRFCWAGKGTTGIPERGVYGPLISAISVENPHAPQTGNSVSAETVVGIVVGAALAIFLILGILWWKGSILRKDTMELDLKGLDLHTGSFTLRQIKAATNNFDATNKIGEGGFGSVYKGLLSDGTIIAVKQLSSKSKQGNREFINEIGMISALQHPNLVKLYGCCVEGNQLLLVYEYMENNSLARALFGPEECQLKLDWPTRHRICIGIARGLAYLHEESRLKVVHRDIKATNILLDKNMDSKISDFGLAKLDEEENTHISTRIAGTYGYMAPEYAMWGYLTDKADVYSFGIVTLEIVSGRSNTSYKSKTMEANFHLLDWALVLKEQGKLMELVDPQLGSEFNKEEVMVTINVALQCTDGSQAVRPTMSSVVSVLEGKAVVQEFVPDTGEAMDPNETKTQQQHSENVAIEGPWTASSTSTADLYPVQLDTEYWERRDAEMAHTLLP